MDVRRGRNIVNTIVAAEKIFDTHWFDDIIFLCCNAHQIANIHLKGDGEKDRGKCLVMVWEKILAVSDLLTVLFQLMESRVNIVANTCHNN